MTQGTLKDIKQFYHPRYKKIFKYLEKNNADNFEWDETCGIWLEMWCNIKNTKVKINIGIDDNYHLWKNGERFGRYSTQHDLLNELEKI